MNRIRSRGLLVVMLIPVLALLPPRHTVQAQDTARCFAETGYCIDGRIREFWEQHGGVAVFGLPISPLHTYAADGQNVQAQWFERTRLELHPENAPPFDVLLGRLGADVLEQQGRDWHTFPKSEPQPGCRYVAETGHNICGAILAAWQASGLEIDGQAGTSDLENLALFGMPLSDAQTEQLSDGRTYTVQWFERARFELHPDNPPPSNVLLGLLGSELQGNQAAAAPATLAHFEPGACPFRVPRDLRIDCGALVVPESRADLRGGVVRLAVAIVRARSPNPAPDPVLYLSGGPGSPALSNTVSFARAWSAFLHNRDLVLIDQRGTGHSRPLLTCPEINDVGDLVIEQNLSNVQKVAAEATALTRCAERLRSAGVNLAAYNSAASATDLHDLRVALGYAQWNIFGVSYGTRLALTTMRDYPEDIRSVVLDSVYPLQTNLYTAMPPTIDRSFQTIFTNCAARPSCNAAYPDLENVFYELVTDLNANPVAIQVTHPRTGAAVETRIDGHDLIDILFRTTYRTAELPGLPQFIYDIRNGEYATLARLESDRLGRMFGSKFSHGMYFAVQCSEEIPFAALEDVQAAAATYPRLGDFFAGVMEFTEHVYALCDAFGTGAPDPRENEPVQSALPTLLLAGEYDPITPPAWAPLAAETLSTSYTYTFPGTGHAVISRGACPVSMIRAFLSDPYRAPDASCIR
jgi:pimeloyl-ACP methyl ester carboxylesterase